MEVPDGWRRAHPKQPPDGPDGCRTHQHSSSGLKSRLTTSTREDAWFAEGPPRAWNGPSCSGGGPRGVLHQKLGKRPHSKMQPFGPPQARNWPAAGEKIMGSSPISGKVFGCHGFEPHIGKGKERDAFVLRSFDPSRELGNRPPSSFPFGVSACRSRCVCAVSNTPVLVRW